MLVFMTVQVIYIFGYNWYNKYDLSKTDEHECPSMRWLLILWGITLTYKLHKRILCEELHSRKRNKICNFIKKKTGKNSVSDPDSGVFWIQIQGLKKAALRSRSRWSRNYLRPGAGVDIIFLINIVFTAVSFEDARLKKNFHWDLFLIVLLL